MTCFSPCGTFVLNPPPINGTNKNHLQTTNLYEQVAMQNNDEA